MLLHGVQATRPVLVEFRMDVCVCVFFPGALYPTSMRISEQGRLVVNFHTKAHFRGLFVKSHSSGTIKRSGETETLSSYQDCIQGGGGHKLNSCHV